MSGVKRTIIEKGQVLKIEEKLAETISEDKKNSDFGFKCLHYSVSEASK